MTDQSETEVVCPSCNGRGERNYGGTPYGMEECILCNGRGRRQDRRAPVHRIAAFTGGGEENVGITRCGERIEHPNKPTQVGLFTADPAKVTCPDCAPEAVATQAFEQVGWWHDAHGFFALSADPDVLRRRPGGEVRPVYIGRGAANGATYESNYD